MTDQQLPLGREGSPRARHTDPDTSKDAADGLADQRANYVALLRALHAADPYPLTDWQAAQHALEYHGATGQLEAVRRRMGDLRQQLGWAEWTGDREGRRGLSRLTDDGRRAAQEGAT